MGQIKKTAKGRLDKYYHLAKEQGYRARSAFKLIELNRKYQFLEDARALVDLCAAPGGWLQVAAKYMPMSRIIVGVDLVPIRPIPGVTTLVSDITTDTCRSLIKKEIKDWKVDVVLHDGAPNVGSSWSHDAFSQAELVLSSLRLAVALLRPGGVFVTKIFRSKDYNSLMWVFSKLFKNVVATKPASSRNVSAEIFVICQSYLAPQKLDPRFLDPKYVFQDIQDGDGSIAQKSLNIFKSQKVRSRGGYEDDVTILFKTASLTDFLSTGDPVSFLGSFNKIEIDIKEIEEMTSPDILSNCGDLKVLGKGEFRSLLKWRHKLLKDGFGSKEGKQVENGSSSIVVEEAPLSDSEEIFSFKQKVVLPEQEEDLAMASDSDVENGLLEEESNDLSLDDQLEEMYSKYKKRINANDAIEIAFKKIDEPEERHREVERSQEKYLEREPDGSQTSEDEQDDVSLNSPVDEEKARKASLFFARPIFGSFGSECENDKMDDVEPSGRKASAKASRVVRMKRGRGKTEENIEDRDVIEFVKSDVKGFDDPFTDSDRKSLLTPEGMTLALKIREGKSGKKELIDGSFNRYSFDDRHDLPSWFKEDEQRHSTPSLPISKEAVELLRDKLKSISSRPNKKAVEAKLRKRMRATKKLDSIKAKANMVADSEELSEAQKSASIQKMMRNAAKGGKGRKKTLVVARGRNKGVKSRPKGVKGRYKMVDPRLKKDIRAEKGRTGKGRDRR
ncbi:unnamed protein product [Sphagnum compactum]